jgi:hypothetical protein
MRTLTTILLASVCLLYSCRQSDKPAKPAAHAADSTKSAKDTTAKTPDQATKKDSNIVVHHRHENPEDLYAKSRLSCPVIVKKCSIVTSRGGLKDVVVTIQNNAVKKISTIKIAWILYNKSGKKLDYSNGMAKKEVARGRSASYSWDIDTRKATKAKAFVYSIRYKDGTTWKVE